MDIRRADMLYHVLFDPLRTLLGRCDRTYRRWIAEPDRVPAYVWTLIDLVAFGRVPFVAWRDWRFSDDGVRDPWGRLHTTSDIVAATWLELSLSRRADRAPIAAHYDNLRAVNDSRINDHKPHEQGA